MTAALLSVFSAHILFFPLSDVGGYVVLFTFLGTAALLTTLVETLSATGERLWATEQDRARESHLKVFIEQAPVAIAMFDRDMRYIAASHRWLSDYQVAVTNITGLSHYQVFPDIPQRYHDAHRRAMAGETLCCDQDEFILKDGTQRWERWGQTLASAGGEVGGITIFTEDITGRVLAEQELRENKKYLNRAQSVARVGNWRMVFASDALQGSAQTFEILGQPANARLNFQMLLDLVHPEDRERISAARKSALKGESTM